MADRSTLVSLAWGKIGFVWQNHFYVSLALATVEGLQRTLTRRCLPADAYPILNEIEKPQVWRKTRQPVRYKTKLGLFCKIHKLSSLFA